MGPARPIALDETRPDRGAVALPERLRRSGFGGGVIPRAGWVVLVGWVVWDAKGAVVVRLVVPAVGDVGGAGLRIVVVWVLVAPIVDDVEVGLVAWDVEVGLVARLGHSGGVGGAGLWVVVGEPE